MVISQAVLQETKKIVQTAQKCLQVVPGRTTCSVHLSGIWSKLHHGARLSMDLLGYSQAGVPSGHESSVQSCQNED